MTPPSAADETRVVMLSPLQRDLAMATEVLGRAGFYSDGFSDANGFMQRVAERGAGMLLISAEALLEQDAVTRLTETLHGQPAWSELPVAIITHSRIADPQELRAVRGLEHLPSITFLDRPVRIAALVSTVRAALQARSRQYQVRELLREADERVRQRDEFLAMLSHELRNPLSAISNGVNVLRVQSPENDKMTALLERQVNHLSRMVDDLLDVARITSGKVTLKKEPVDLDAVLTDAAETVTPYVKERQHQLTVVRGRKPIQVMGDSARLTQIVANLLHNAAKYTQPNGQIHIALETTDQHAVLRVRDSGVGIESDHLERIFELFAQGTRDLDRSQGGLGVGLTIVHRLVQMHGGDVFAHSDGPDKGSEFCVRLPLANQTAAVHPGGAEAPASNVSCRVLVVDDNAEVADGLASLIEALGHEVRTVYGGQQALAAVPDFLPDVVFLDLGMPDMDGFDVARALSTLPQRQHMQVVAITGYGDDQTVAEARGSGFDRHLLKPARLQALQDILRAAKRPDAYIS